MHAIEDVIRYENMKPNSPTWYKLMRDHYMK